MAGKNNKHKKKTQKVYVYNNLPKSYQNVDSSKIRFSNYLSKNRAIKNYTDDRYVYLNYNKDKNNVVYEREHKNNTERFKLKSILYSPKNSNKYKIVTKEVKF